MKQQTNFPVQEPKILLFDIETSPNLGYVWGKYQQDVIDYENEWYMLSFACKWLGDDKVYCKTLRDYKTYSSDPTNDKELVADLWDLMNEADIVVGHNSRSFDHRKTNARFIYHGMVPPAPYRIVDTKEVAKQNFHFNSNKLTDLGKYLGVGQKMPTGGFDLWKGCMTGNKKSWETMAAYNKQDVVLLEKVYLKLRPWHKTHPNLNTNLGGHVCPKCGSQHLQSRGVSRTLASIYRRFQCMGCGAWSRSTKSEKDTRVKITNL